MHICIYVYAHSRICSYDLHGGGGGGLVAKLGLTLMSPWTVARQVSLSIGFSRQEYWSGVPYLVPNVKTLKYLFRVQKLKPRSSYNEF